MPAGAGVVAGSVGDASTGNVTAVVAEPSELVAVTLKVPTPDAVGVPEMTPVDVFSVRPAGRDPVIWKVNGPVPVGATVVE